MREAIFIGTVVGLLFFAAGAVMTALAVKYATSAALWDVVLWSGVGLMIASLASLALYIWSQTTGGAFWIPAALLNLGICIILSGIAYSYSTVPNQKQVQAFSWIWDPLSDSEIQQLTAALNGQKAAKIGIACNRRICAKVADSLHTAFRSAGWSTENLPLHTVLQEGITGAAITPDDEVSRAIKGAIETTTSLQIALMLPRFQAINNPTNIVIGGKPLPDPLPAEIKEDMAGLGGKLKQLSIEIARFVADRQAAEDLLPKRETYPPDTAGVGNWFSSMRDFRSRTNSIFAERFGALIIQYLTRLEIIGVEPPWGRDSPAERGKWFGLIGEFLEKGSVVEARERGPDIRFWWDK
jgi:hypothetical protein